MYPATLQAAGDNSAQEIGQTPKNEDPPHSSAAMCKETTGLCRSKLIVFCCSSMNFALWSHRWLHAHCTGVWRTAHPCTKECADDVAKQVDPPHAMQLQVA